MIPNLQELWLAFIAIALTVTLLSVTRSVLYKYRLYRAKQGHYGDVSKWVVELSEEDEVFATYFYHLPKNHTMEVCVIAESKEELRELTFKRVEEIIN